MKPSKIREIPKVTCPDKLQQIMSIFTESIYIFVPSAFLSILLNEMFKIKTSVSVRM